MTYRRHALIEYWAHAACFVPASHYRAWRRAMLDYRRRHRGWSGWLRNRRVLDAVEARIREQGPAGTSDFDAPPRHDGLVELEARGARARLPVDDRPDNGAFAAALSEAL